MSTEMGLFERLGAALRREQSGQIRRLPCLHADQLITGLGCLQDVGAGPIGLAALLTAQFYSPAEIIIIDLDDNR